MEDQLSKKSNRLCGDEVGVLSAPGPNKAPQTCVSLLVRRAFLKVIISLILSAISSTSFTCWSPPTPFSSLRVSASLSGQYSLWAQAAGQQDPGGLSLATSLWGMTSKGPAALCCGPWGGDRPWGRGGG